MKITRAYIDEPKPKSCRGCKFGKLQLDEDGLFVHVCVLTERKYLDMDNCPLIYAPSRSVMRRLDIQMPLDDKGEE